MKVRMGLSSPSLSLLPSIDGCGRAIGFPLFFSLSEELTFHLRGKKVRNHPFFHERGINFSPLIARPQPSTEIRF
jgi:hypothetical protein